MSRLDRIAKTKKMSRSQLIRHILRQYLAKQYYVDILPEPKTNVNFASVEKIQFLPKIWYKKNEKSRKNNKTIIYSYYMDGKIDPSR